jgi:hypothetical protein
MTYRPSRYQPGKRKKCWCGSGKKQKNCHPTPPGRPVAAAAAEVEAVRLVAVTKAPEARPKAWGVPGEEYKLWVVPVMKGQNRPGPAELGGKPGLYKVQFLLSRPGYPIMGEREHKFIDDVVGDSHIVIAKPARVRKPEDIDHILLEVKGRGIRFIGTANDNGYLGKLSVAELPAASMQDAENVAYECLAPFLSAWSLHLDIPVHVETIQITELRTSMSSLRVRTPTFEMTFAGGVSPLLTDEFCHYASLYREGLNSNNNFYRFLCFYKIIESIIARRGRIDQAKRKAGEEIHRIPERLPNETAGFMALLKEVYPWRTNWDDMALEQIFPKEVWDKKLTAIRDKYFDPLRVGIAHALLKTGEVRITLDKIDHLQQVNKWLGLCRVLARVMLCHEFPKEFDFVHTDVIEAGLWQRVESPLFDRGKRNCRVEREKILGGRGFFSLAVFSRQQQMSQLGRLAFRETGICLAIYAGMVPRAGTAPNA